MRRLQAVYAALGTPQGVETVYFSDGHRLPPSVAGKVYDWLERLLKPA